MSLNLELWKLYTHCLEISYFIDFDGKIKMKTSSDESVIASGKLSIRSSLRKGDPKLWRTGNCILSWINFDCLSYNLALQDLSHGLKKDSSITGDLFSLETMREGINLIVTHRDDFENQHKNHKRFLYILELSDLCCKHQDEKFIWRFFHYKHEFFTGNHDVIKQVC